MIVLKAGRRYMAGVGACGCNVSISLERADSALTIVCANRKASILKFSIAPTQHPSPKFWIAKGVDHECFLCLIDIAEHLYNHGRIRTSKLNKRKSKAIRLQAQRLHGDGSVRKQVPCDGSRCSQHVKLPVPSDSLPDTHGPA